MAMAPLSGSSGLDGRAHGRTEPGRMYQVPERTGHHGARLGGYRSAGRVPRLARLCVLALTCLLVIAACSGGAVAAFDPSGPCASDGSAPGAYPELESRIPATLLGAKPTTLDSGRHCTPAALGSLTAAGISEIPFPAGTRSFRAERDAAPPLFHAP